MMQDIGEDIKLILKSLERNRFDARYAETEAEAKAAIMAMIPPTASIGIGDSTTLKQIGIIDDLVRDGFEVVNPFTAELMRDTRNNPVTLRRFMDMAKMALRTDIFLTGCNAVTRDGKIVSIDYTGNRVVGMIFGVPKAILVVGRNKIVGNIDEAIYRIKNVIAPTHAKQRGRKTPCAKTSKCTDCSSQDRICNVTVTLEKTPSYTELSIIIINQDLGLSWDSAWDKERINRIKSHYQTASVFL